MSRDEWRRELVREQFAAPVREYRPGLEPIDDVTAARNRQTLCDAMNSTTEEEVA
jgi:hypothetical protein